jgi:hypothetical protein
MIRRVYEANGILIEPHIDKCLSQLALINGVRNDLVHFGATFDGRAIGKISTARMAHIPERIREIEISPDILFAMSFDISKIILVLSVTSHADDELGDQHDHYREAVESVMLRAWRYTPSSQASNRRKPPDTRSKPKHPRKPSPRSPRLQD